MEHEITCINCPVGCRMTAVTDENGQVVSVTGNTCVRGDKYARQECVAPERMITAVIPVRGSHMPLSVKTRTTAPKKLIPDIMRELGKLDISAPFRAGDVVVPNVCGCGVDIIATKSVG